MYRSVEFSLTARAVIFDLDGVLVNSHVAVDRTWADWGQARGLDLDLVRRSIPGKRTRDAVALLAPDADADAEAAWIVAREIALEGTVTPIPGALAFVASLPAGRWGISTSGTTAVACGRLTQAGFAAPAVFITADMVSRGKPDPECYRQAAAALATEPAACLVFEDAPSGIAAASAAGCTVIGVETWAEPGLLATPYTIRDFHSIRASIQGDLLRFAFSAKT